MKLSIKLLIANFSLILLSLIISDLLVFPALDTILKLDKLSSLVGLSIKYFVAFLLTAVPLSLGYWIYLHKVIIKPIKEVIRITNVIATGNLGERLKITTRDEIGEMSSNLNIMIQNLANAFQSMANSLRDTLIKERQLEQEKEKLAKAKATDDALLEGIGDGIVAIDNLGKIIFGNKEIKNLLGWDISEILGKFWHEAIPARDLKSGELLPDDQQLLMKALHFGEKINFITLFARKNQSKFPVSATASPIILNNKISGVIIVFRNITKEFEIDRMKTEFISLASHQLRTPLAAIRWLTELMLDPKNVNGLSGEQKALALNISQSTNRMIELVNILLNISRIESGRLMIVPAPTDITKLIEETPKDIEDRIKQKNINLIKSVQENLPQVNLDSKMIRQVLLNLLTNAVKYTQPGGKITIKVIKDDKDLIFQVEDTGIGIPLKDRPKIFQKFFRADNAQKIETDGTGLGLYLAKIIVDSSLGKIWFTSEEGKGTSFYFTLPLSGMVAKKGEVTLS